MQIWKWPLRIDDIQTLMLPANAKILTIQLHQGEPQLWALCDSKQTFSPRTIAIYGTGNHVPDAVGVGEYIATFQEHRGVWHAFELSA